MSTEKPKIPRVLTFDLLRGYFLIAITMNHLYYFPGFLDSLTMRGQLFVSSAEGFFLISGLILGLVRGIKLIDKPFKFVSKLLLKRSLQLYLTYIVMTFLFTLAGWLYFGSPGLKPGIADPNTTLLTMIWEIISFQYLYGWADYLRLYCLFIALSPLVMWLLRKGKWNIVLAASLSIWLLSPPQDWPMSVYFQPLTWQLIFYGGMVIGFHWPNIANFWRSLSTRTRKISKISIVSLASITLAVNIFIAFGGMIGPEIHQFTSSIRNTLQQPYFDKENLPAARFALFMLWFWASFIVFRHFEKAIMKFFGWMLLPFGTNSLYMYIVSGVIIFFVHLYTDSAGRLFNTLVFVAILATVWLMIRYKILMKVIPR